MLAVNEAKKKTQNNIDNCVTKELDEISKQIEDAISHGSFSINNDGYLQSETRKRLESLGYKVETSSQYNEAYYSVSWA